MYSWILFARSLLRISHLCSSVILACTFLFLCPVFVWFWYQHDGGLVEWVWKCSLLYNFLKEFGLLFVGSVLITVSMSVISMLVSSLFIISISPWFSLGRSNFQRNQSISFKLPNLLAYIAFLLCLLLFSFIILLIWFFSVFLLLNLANDLSILFVFSENQLLVLSFYYCFLHFFFIYFCSDFYDFLPTNFGVFLFFFFSCFRCKVRLPIWYFSCVLR